MRTPGNKNDYSGTDQLKTKATQARSLNGVAIFIRILCSSFVKNTPHYSSQLNRSPGRKQSPPRPKGVPPIGLLLFTTTNTLNSHKGSVREAYNTATSDSPPKSAKKRSNPEFEKTLDSLLMSTLAGFRKLSFHSSSCVVVVVVFKQLLVQAEARSTS